MFGINKTSISNYIWYLKKLYYFRQREKSAKRNLSYFEFIRKTEPFRQNIGRHDLNTLPTPLFNSKNERQQLRSSEDMIFDTLRTLPKERKKLKRWLRMKNKLNKYSKSKVKFENEESVFTIR